MSTTPHDWQIMADFARDLERQLAAVTAERDELKANEAAELDRIGREGK